MKQLPLTTTGLFLATIVFFACAKSNAPTTPTTPPSKPDSTPVPAAKKWWVSTLAGNGTAGFADGDSTQVEFSNAQCMAIDASGNLFVGDVGNQRIRKITPGGAVSTWASDAISNPNPLFGNFAGLVVDSHNDVFSIDYGLIRKFTTNTTPTVFAGSMKVGYIDSTGSNADFNIVYDLAIDRQDNMFLPDYDTSNRFRLRKVTPAGVVSTLPLQDNTGYPSDGLPNFHYYYSIAVDSSGNIFVTGNGNCLIKKVTPQGDVSIFAGAGNIGFTDGIGRAAQFSTILGMTCDGAGNLWVADGDNHAIRKVTPDGTVTTIAGKGTMGFSDGDSTQALFSYPTGITVDKNGVVYVVDNGNNRIRKLVYK